MKKITIHFFGVLMLFGCSSNNAVDDSAVIPLAPSALEGTLNSNTQVTLNWTDNSTNETEFKIERKSGTGNYTQIASVNADITTYVDNGLIASSTYTYRLLAYNSAGNSLSYSNQATIITSDPIKIPIITTNDISSLSYTTAISGGSISSDGGSGITERGVVWGTSSSPTISLTTKTSDGSGNGNFSSSISNLSTNTTYYIRAYATNSAGTSYGQENSFKTLALTVPTLSSSSIINIKSTSAQGGGTITSNGGSTVTQRGVVWGTSPSPTISLTTKTSDGNGNGSFSSNIPSLVLNITYYVRAFATNSIGTGYGNEISFTTSYAIGETGPAGGFIFYDKGVSSNGWRYLEANYADYSSGIGWWNGTWTYKDMVGISPNTGLGSGKANTLLIIAANNNLNNAAKVCDDYSYNGFTDWYLPSSEELQLMCQNLYSAGKGNFTPNFYWSSTDTNRIHNATWMQFNGSYVRTDSGRNDVNLVRPIRQF